MTIENIWGLVRDEQYDLANDAIKLEFSRLDNEKQPNKQYHQSIVQLIKLDAYNSLRDGKGDNSLAICNDGRSFLLSARSVEPSLGDRLHFRILEGLALASTGLGSESIINFRDVGLRDCSYFEDFFYELGIKDSPQHAAEVAFNAYRDLMENKGPNADMTLRTLGRYAGHHELTEWNTDDPKNHVLVATKVDPKDLRAWTSLSEDPVKAHEKLHSPEWIRESQQVF